MAKGKGRGWHGDSAGYSAAARKSGSKKEWLQERVVARRKGVQVKKKIRVMRMANQFMQRERNQKEE